VKEIKLTDVGTLKNELKKYKTGKKLGIPQFNQAARMAWLGKIVLSPLDPEDAECRAYLLYVPPPEGLAERFLDLDEELLARIHILDAEQGTQLAAILRDGVEARAKDIEALNRRDFYFQCHFGKDGRK
jgi:hypothetical protein